MRTAGRVRGACLGNGLAGKLNVFVEDYRPSTFLERGVAVPFTTPLLSSARVRLGHRLRLEFLISNPAGGAGYYVLHWDGILGLARITVHDRLLYDHVARIEFVTPTTIRETARTVAETGSAGRPAAAAARATRQKEYDDRLIANYLLTMRLMQQAGLKDVDWRSLDPADRNVRTRMRTLVERLEPLTGAKADTIFAWVEELSAIVAPLGFGGTEYVSRLGGTLSAVKHLHASLLQFAGSDVTEAAAAAQFIAEVAQVTIEIAESIFAACHAELRDLARLLLHWSAQRDRLLELFARPDWLLDGWHAIATLWDSASAGGRDQQRAVIPELQRMVPVMPREASDWVGDTLLVERANRQRRWVKANIDWRTGVHVVDRTARNEMLRAAIP